MPPKEKLKYKYKVGDRVRVKKYEDILKYKGLIVGRIAFMPLMEKLCGKEVVIERLDKFASGVLYYRIEGSNFAWSDEMFEEIIEHDWSVEQKPIVSMDDVLVILSTYAECGNYTCETCPIRDYELKKGNSCSTVLIEAVNFYKGYNEYKSKPTPKAPKRKEIEVSNPKGNYSCAECKYRKAVDGGYVFCEKWHNITRDDGYCHYFDP